MTRILVIKLAALGDMVQAFAAMGRIRTAHPDAEITLLTTPLFADLARASPYVDKVETDGRPGSLIATVADVDAAAARALRPGLRPADLVAFVGLFPGLAAQPAGVVGHRGRRLTPPRQPPPQRHAHPGAAG